MERIAFISGGIFIYWSSIILALAALAAIAIFAAVYIGKSNDVVGTSVTIPLAMVASIVLSRLVHWYCRADAYESMGAALTDYTKGGYALMGVFVACLAVAAILRLLRVVKNLLQMYDSMAIGAGVGIAVGRLASLFNASDRGMALPDSVGFPFAFPVTNTVSGVVENRLATFMIQSGIVAAVVVLLLLYMLISKIARHKIPDGDICLIFLLAYGAGQIICDSTRYDSLFLRSNGFVSIVQILGLVALLVPIVVFSVRAVKYMGIKPIHFVLWVLILGMMGLAGYMEYYVQRHGNEAVFAYSMMAGGLIGIVLATLVLRGVGNYAGQRKAALSALMESLVREPAEETVEASLAAEEPVQEPREEIETDSQEKVQMELYEELQTESQKEKQSENQEDAFPEISIVFPKETRENLPKDISSKIRIEFSKTISEES